MSFARTALSDSLNALLGSDAAQIVMLCLLTASPDHDPCERPARILSTRTLSVMAEIREWLPVSPRLTEAQLPARRIRKRRAPPRHAIRRGPTTIKTPPLHRTQHEGIELIRATLGQPCDSPPASMHSSQIAATCSPGVGGVRRKVSVAPPLVRMVAESAVMATTSPDPMTKTRPWRS